MKLIKLILLLMVFSSCSKEEQPTKTLEDLYPIIDKIESDINLYVIDSCEYIGYINNWNADILTHKGNCKYCIKRNK